jgi:hypothetical protein
MDFDPEEDRAKFADMIGGIVQSDCYPVEQRLWDVTDWLKKAGVEPETIILHYFNEAIRVTMKERGTVGAYFLACQFYWHLVKIIKKLNDLCDVIKMHDLPHDPLQATPPQE